jgi:subtilisin-like proprotein convertase family protein
VRISRGSAAARFLVLLVLVTGVAPRSHAETVYALDSVELRTDPDRNGTVHQTVPSGTPLEVLGRHQSWLRVAAPDSGYALYVESSRVGVAPPAATPSSPGTPARAPVPAPAAAPVAPPQAAREAASRPVTTTAAKKPSTVGKAGSGHGKLLLGAGVLAAGGGAALVVGARGSGGGDASAAATGQAGPTSAVVFVSSDVPKRFADASASVSALMVSGLEGTITDARVTVHLSASCARDLALQLVHPDGTTVVLVFQGSSGCSPLQLAATFPTERPPYEPLAKLFGKPAGGAWSLRASDVAAGGGGGGELGAWSLALTTGR